MNRRRFIAVLGALIVSRKMPCASGIGSEKANQLARLFDHKRALEENAKVIRQLNEALVLNAPSGFRAVTYRYSATDVRALGVELRRRRARGTD